MADEKTVTNLSIRAAYDSLGEIVGEKARTIILRGCGLVRLVDSPPPYDWNKEFTNQEHLLIFQEVMRIFGKVGGQGVIRQIGYKNASNLEKLGILAHLKDLPPEEKYTKCLELLSIAINRGKVIRDPAGRVALDVHDCTACTGARSDKPYCSQYAGALQFFAEWSFGKGKYRVIESKCKAMGDETCYLELRDM